MKKILFTLAALSLIDIYAAIYIPNGKVEFTAKGFPTFITIKGEGQGLKGQIDIEGEQVKSATISFPLKSLKTGMDLRDQHMHDKYLESQKYPLATLDLPSFELKDSGEVKGKLKLHNVEKEIKVKYEATKSETVKISAQFQIILEDFAIDIPSFQGITVAKDIALNVQLEANKK